MTAHSSSGSIPVRRAFATKRKGQAAVEFAIILPVLVLMTVAMLDLGRAFYFQTAIANAAKPDACRPRSALSNIRA